MATIDDKRIITDLLTSNGRYMDDPQCVSIWSYVNAEGRTTCSVFWGQNDMNSSPWVNYPKLLWSQSEGLTKAGAQWLAKNAK